MGSILKRISSTSQLDRHIEELAHIHFNLDEPDFLINKKLEMVSGNLQHSQHFLTSYTHSCEMCGNVEISSHAKFCRICGSEFSDK